MNDNTNQLYDLISNIQAKLNTENDNSSTENINSENTNNSNNQNINNNDSQTDNNTNSNFDFSNVDINTILKMQGLFSKFNKNTPKKNLLYSLKPFLNEDRQSKLGEYITILSIMDALDIFGKKGSDKNV